MQPPPPSFFPVSSPPCAHATTFKFRVSPIGTYYRQPGSFAQLRGSFFGRGTFRHEFIAATG